MMILVLIAMFILTTYIVSMRITTGRWPASLSQSVYDLPTYSGRILWMTIIWSVAFLLMPAVIDISSEETKFIAFFACAGLIAVGGAPLLRERDDLAYKVHMTGAYASAIASQLLILLNEPLLLLCWVTWVAAFVWQTKDKQKWQQAVFWAEMTCFASIFILVLI